MKGLSAIAVGRDVLAALSFLAAPWVPDRVGPLLAVLDPVRVYQDFANVHLDSHGRAEIIAGCSALVEPFAFSERGQSSRHRLPPPAP